MIGDVASVDATRIVGVAAFGSAFLVCARRALVPSSRPRPAWAALAVGYAALVGELQAELRFRVHDDAVAWLVGRGEYGSRGGWHPLLLATVIAVAIVVFGVLFIRLRRRGGVDAALLAAILATMALGVLFVCEIVSLHAVDAVLYAPAGPWKAIGWAWLGAASIVIVAGLRGRRRLGYADSQHSPN